MFYTVDTTTRLLLAGPTVQFPDGATKGETPDEWVQPVGGADAYSKGDRVTFEGAVWEEAPAMTERFTLSRTEDRP